MSKAHIRQPHVIRRLRRNGPAAMVRELATSTVDDVSVHSVRVQDGYAVWRFSLQRLLYYWGAAAMNWYLARRPQITFDHKANVVRKFLYHLPSFSEWSKLMENQGSLAMEALHNPEVKHLSTGRRLGPVTRRLFRHGADPVGVRARTVLAGWLARSYIQDHPGIPVRWLSLAGGSAFHSSIMMEIAEVDKSLLTFIDVDKDPAAIKSAGTVTQASGLLPAQTHLITGNVLDKRLIAGISAASEVDIIDMLGILEYLDDTQARQLLVEAYALLRPCGIILLCNMRQSHPQLALHKRGVGWPGVIPRTTEEFIALCKSGGDGKNITIYQSLDGVYNVAILVKKK